MINNPFESSHHFIENLQSNTFSPSIFAKSATSSSTSSSSIDNAIATSTIDDDINITSSSSQFRWSIDHMAVLNPADIDEHSMHQQISNHDPETETRMHDAIEHFWSSQKQIAPSPECVAPRRSLRLRPNYTRIVSSPTETTTTDRETPIMRKLSTSSSSSSSSASNDDDDVGAIASSTMISTIVANDDDARLSPILFLSDNDNEIESSSYDAYDGEQYYRRRMSKSLIVDPDLSPII